MRLKNILWILIFIISIVLNFLGLLDFKSRPDYKLGTLQQDITVVDYRNDSKVLFIMPKGSTVMNVSPRGLAKAGLLDPARFSIIIASPSSDFIDYSNNNSKSPYGALYRISRSR
jgi:hypothetical protein